MGITKDTSKTFIQILQHTLYRMWNRIWQFRPKI